MDCEEKKSFSTVAGFKLVYHPEACGKATAKKHPCPDCHFCQQCGESRCHGCREGRSGKKSSASRKLSLEEQLKLYEEINREE